MSKTQNVVSTKPQPQFVVATPEKAKRGALKKFVAKASKLRRFTREQLTAAVRGTMPAKRAKRYFYWCTGHALFKHETDRTKAAKKTVH